MVDLQFKAIKDQDKVNNDIVSQDECVIDVEHLIMVYKERNWCYWVMMPFETIPASMMVHLMMTELFYVNMFALKSSVPQFLSLTIIVEGGTLDCNKHFQVISGKHAQMFEGSDSAMMEQTISEIARRPTGSLQGGIRFFAYK